jgi:hypothetical protein
VPEEFWANAVFSLVPTILVGLIFWFVLRAIFRSDRTERNVYAKVEAEERARMGMPAAKGSAAARATAAASASADRNGVAPTTASSAAGASAMGSSAAGASAMGSSATSTAPASSASATSSSSATASSARPE